MRTIVISAVLSFLFLFLGLRTPSFVSAEPEEIQLASLSPGSVSMMNIPRISMDMQEVSLQDLLRAFSQQSGLNFIAGEVVRDRLVTLYISDVSVEDALSSIINATGLTYRRLEDSDIFIVDEPRGDEELTITRIFKLQYAYVTGFGFDSSTDEEPSISEASDLASSDTGEETGDSGTTDGIDTVVTELLSSHGRLVADQRTNSLIVTDTPQQMERIAETIAQLDTRTPQVLIAADILDTTSQVVDDIGFEWGDTADGQVFTLTGSSRPTSFPFDLDVGFLKNPAGTDGTITAGALGFDSVDVTLDLLTQNTDTEVLARPRILTLANQTAIIELTSETAVASVTTIASTDSGLSTSTSGDAERVDTGITLRVTPQVNDFGYITMLVEPSVVDAVDSQFFSNTFADPRTRSSRTTVRVKNGRTIVIGGLISKTNTDSIRKVPVLGDIPIMGYLFTRIDHNDTDRELIMFITPTILNESDSGLENTELVDGRNVKVDLGDWTFAQEAGGVRVRRERDAFVPTSGLPESSREAEIEHAIKHLTNGVDR